MNRGPVRRARRAAMCLSRSRFCFLPLLLPAARSIRRRLRLRRRRQRRRQQALRDIELGKRTAQAFYCVCPPLFQQPVI